MTDQDPIDLALKQPISADQFTPKDLHLDKKEGLTIVWADGVTSRFSLVFLRKACPCATCRTEREKPKPASSGLSLNILPDNISRATQLRWRSEVPPQSSPPTASRRSRSILFRVRYPSPP